MKPSVQVELEAKGQHGSCATVRVKADNADGYAVINESDFDSAKHEKFVAPAPKEAAKVDEQSSAKGQAKK